MLYMTDMSTETSDKTGPGRTISSRAGTLHFDTLFVYYALADSQTAA